MKIHFFFRTTFFFLFLIFGLTSCRYSMKGISIPDGTENYYVAPFGNNASGGPPSLGQVFKERLRDRIRRDTRLSETEVDPNIEFTGYVNSFLIEQIAPQPGEFSAANELTISVFVEYTNHLDDRAGFSRTYSENAQFSSDQNLLSIQDNLIDEIYEIILEKVFNDAFTNW